MHDMPLTEGGAEELLQEIKRENYDAERTVLQKETEKERPLNKAEQYIISNKGGCKNVNDQN